MFNEKAISPVLGIIFMVMMTLIMATAVTAFVVGATQQVQENSDIDDIIYFDAPTYLEDPDDEQVQESAQDCTNEEDHEST